MMETVRSWPRSDLAILIVTGPGMGEYLIRVGGVARLETARHCNGERGIHWSGESWTDW